MQRFIVTAWSLVLACGLLAGCSDDTVGPVDDADVTQTTDTVLATDTVDATDPGDTDVADTDDPSDATTATTDAGDTALGDTGDTTDADDGVLLGTCEVASPDVRDPGDVVIFGDVPYDVEGASCTPTPPQAFDDHAVASFDDPACVIRYGNVRGYPAEVKFVISGFEEPGDDRPVFFMDPSFYQLHDEWYWFRLLNGTPIPDFTLQAPASGYDFDTIAQVYAAFAGMTNLPVGLVYLEHAQRIYAPLFYSNAGLFTSSGGVEEPRFFGVGTLLYYPPNPDRGFPDQIWAFQLEYQDKPTQPELLRFFTLLSQRLPPEVADELRWLARSPAQTALALSIRDSQSQLRERVLVPNDTVVEGAVEVYNPGIVAGPVKVFRTGFDATATAQGDIVFLNTVPDDIPPVRGIVSAVPQTALAHVNLLAKSRGTPNAFVAGVLSWSRLLDWERLDARVIMQAMADGTMRWGELSSNDYTSYLQKLAPTLDRTIPQVDDLDSAPLTVDLTAAGLADMRAVVPLAGGKCAGMMAFQDFPSMETPSAPLCLTIRGYHQHVAPMIPTITALLANATFQSDVRVRALLLSGETRFREDHFGDAESLQWLAQFKAATPTGVLRQVLDAGGVMGMIEAANVDATWLADVRAALEARYAHLAPTQGLRFRSSATAEDVRGFNGAGLYASHTGFLYPEQQTDAKDRARPIERAIRETWASYWGPPAFEERRVAGIDHFEGNMAVLVHPRFDDDREAANGVITYYLSRWGGGATYERRMIVNVQDGALSVTNPGGTSARPEIDEVVACEDGLPAIGRTQASSEVDPGELILSDALLVRLYDEVGALADAWLDSGNAALEAAERGETVVLDLEFKLMAAGWPALASGEVKPARLIYKQVRVLDQAPVVPAGTADPFMGVPLTLYLPDDLETVARRVVSRQLESDLLTVRLARVETRPEAADLFPFAAPDGYTYRLSMRFASSPEGWELPTGVTQRWPHTEFEATQVDGTTTVTFGPLMRLVTKADALELDDSGWALRRGSDTLTGAWTTDVQATPFTSAEAFLEGLLNPAP